jgi:glycosyltransferase involved in cell wall biosynthesis
LKIAFTLGKLNSTSGVGKVVANIVNALGAKEGYEISVICNEALKKHTKLANYVEVITLGIARKQRTDWALMVKPLKKLFMERRFDVLVISGMEFVPIYYFVAHRSGVRMYAWEHLNFGAGPNFRLEWIGKRLAVRKLQGVISITKRDHQYYREYCEKKRIPGRLYQIYNLTAFKKTEIRYNSNSRKIISVGYLSAIKGFDILTDVAASLLKKCDDWSWDIYGKGSEKEHLQSLIERKHLENHVFLKGYCEEIFEKYSEYGIFVLTSRKEGMGMVLVEAQKSKLPVVSFDIDCGPSDVISDGKNGYLIRPFDVESMADKIAGLLQSKRLREEFSKCSEKNLEEFEEKVIVKKWECLLRDGKI